MMKHDTPISCLGHGSDPAASHHLHRENRQQGERKTVDENKG